MGSGMWLLVMTWGDPGGWSSVRYRVPDLPRVRGCRLADVEWVDVDHEYRSTLGALFEAFGGRVLEAVVYVSDTLALSRHVPGLARENKGLAEACSFEGLGLYEGVVECARRYIGAILDSGGYVGGSFRDRVVVHVLPGVGVYSRDDIGCERRIKAVYIGSPMNYYYGLLIHLYSYLARRGDSIDTVLLDISHGINFMPVLGFKAAIEALKLYMIYSGRQSIRLIVLNSDPVIPRIDLDTPRSINIIFCKELKLAEVLSETYHTIGSINWGEDQRPYRMLKRKKPGEEAEKLKNIGDKLKGLAASISIIVKSLDMGLPLPLAYTIEELRRSRADRLYSELIGAIESILGCRSVKRQAEEPDTIVVEHEVMLTDTVELYLKALTLLKALSRRITVGLEGAEITYDGERTMLYSLDDLERLAEDYIVGGAAREIVGNEISNIRERTSLYKTLCCGGRDITAPIIYKAIYDFTEEKLGEQKLIELYREHKKKEEKEALPEQIWELKNKCPTPSSARRKASRRIDSKRNFFAHAGFYAASTLMQTINNKIYTGYIPKLNYKEVIQKDP